MMKYFLKIFHFFRIATPVGRLSTAGPTPANRSKPRRKNIRLQRALFGRAPTLLRSLGRGLHSVDIYDIYSDAMSERTI